MLIEEIVQSCVQESVASAAVRSIGRAFYADIKEAAATYGMTPGAFAALAVQRFARHKNEAEARSVRAVMEGAQEPVLTGLHRILCIMLAAGVPIEMGPEPDRMIPRAAEIDRLECASFATACC